MSHFTNKLLLLMGLAVSIGTEAQTRFTYQGNTLTTNEHRLLVEANLPMLDETHSALLKKRYVPPNRSRQPIRHGQKSISSPLSIGLTIPTIKPYACLAKAKPPLTAAK